MSEVLPPSGRRGRRAERRRERRRRRAQVLTALLVVAVVAAAAFVVTRMRGDDPPPATVEAQDRTQATLLLQVQGGDGGALASALLALDPASGNGTVVLVPPQVIADVAGAGSSPFGRILATGTEDSSRNALADLLGVTVDDGWVVVGAEALAALVDALGGIEVAVDAPVLEGPTVLLGPGQQRLTGAQVVTFAGYLGPEEQEQTRLARLQDVLDGLLKALPDDEGEVEALLVQLGDGSRTTLSDDGLAQLLVGLAQAGEADMLQYDTLPVIPIDAGGGMSAFRLDETAAQALVERRLAQSVPEGERATGNRVLVLNGVGTPGIGEVVRGRLVDEGFVFVGSRNAPRFDYANTVVLVPEATPEAQLLGERVAAALGVEADVRTDRLGSLADVIVIVGADFQP